MIAVGITIMGLGSTGKRLGSTLIQEKVVIYSQGTGWESMDRKLLGNIRSNYLLNWPNRIVAKGKSE